LKDIEKLIKQQVPRMGEHPFMEGADLVEEKADSDTSKPRPNQRNRSRNNNRNNHRNRNK